MKELKNLIGFLLSIIIFIWLLIGGFCVVISLYLLEKLGTIDKLVKTEELP